MKLLYICECCDEVVDSLELPGRLPDGMDARLTEVGAINIMNSDGSTKNIVLSTLCDDCREMMYGGSDRNFFGGPTLH
ncbi:MAG: hypothetical protein PHY77_00485 [Desulfotomaculaceae bacterium]|nr:hypothetical protein [Desulfotomaculaceae bacterium]